MERTCPWKYKMMHKGKDFVSEEGPCIKKQCAIFVDGAHAACAVLILAKSALGTRWKGGSR